MRQFLQLSSMIRGSRARSGAVAVEFALIAPILVLIFFAAMELAQVLDCRTRVIDAAASVADLIAQGTSIDDSGLSAMEKAVEAIIYPYDTDGRVQIVITGIKKCDADDSTDSCADQNSDNLTVDWSWASGTGASERSSVPSGLSPDIFSATGAGVVMVELRYTYSSPTTQLLTGNMALNWTAYAIPRDVTAVTYSSGT